MNVIDAAHAVVHDYPGGSVALAPRLGMASAILRGKVNANDTGHHLTLVESVRMQEMTRDHRILFAEADELGYVCIPAPQTSPLDCSHALAQLCAEFGDYMHTVNDSMADRVITTNERKKLEKELAEMVAAAMKLQAALSAQTGTADA